MFRNGGSFILAILLGGLLGAGAPAAAQDDQAIGFERTPPRLSFTDGEVSFWRVGAEDWSPALVNTALAPGDELYTAGGANLEIQVGERAFLRAGEETQLGLTSVEPDFLQLRVTSGYASLDLRSRNAGETVEIDTPNAAFTVEHTGYYRIEVVGETTTFISRRGGRATLTAATGVPAAIAPSEQLVVRGTDAPQIETYAAPELDAWDRWNYARSDSQIDAVSARYVAPGVYGVSDLDRYGDWRLLPTYGAVWVPRGVVAGWAPYSTGRWIYDPYYDWTWVDDAPWGWAPFHYGRWVHVSGFWGWCPGPLVAFFGGGGLSIGISIGRPDIGWVALGWGEPLVPWWGPVGFRSAPHWAGWGGPHIVNKVVVKHKTVIKVREIKVYENEGVRNAIVAVDRDHFGSRSIAAVRRARANSEKFEPLHGDLPIKPGRGSLVAAEGPAKRPPREDLRRRVVATRAPQVAPPLDLKPRRAERKAATRPGESALPDAVPPTRVVEPPREGRRIKVSERPPFGRNSGAERGTPPPLPRFEGTRGKETGSHAEGVRAEQPREAPVAPAESQATQRRASRARPPELPQERPQSVEAARPSPPQERGGQQHERVERERRGGGAVSSRPERKAAPARELPGEPANRVYRRNPGEHSRDAGQRRGEKKAGQGRDRGSGGSSEAR
jgi:hypothetical protein